MNLVKASPTIAFLKLGIYGFAGSGKTYTATNFATGLAKRIKSKKPIAFFDTETGSDFMIPRVKAAGHDLLVPDPKTRALKDVKTFIQEASKVSEILIIDSVSHIWADLQESYMAKKERTKLSFPDWGILKKEWRQFTDLFLAVGAHVIICGRAGYEYEHETDEQTGKITELKKVGTRMRAEGEFGYEPSLLLEIERVRNDNGGWMHEATVIKDRTDLMNGKVFTNPTFTHIEPHLNFLNIGGEHKPLDTSVNSTEMFSDNGNSYYVENKKKEVLLEEIKAYLDLKFPSQGKAKQIRIALLQTVFGGYSAAALENKTSDELKTGFDTLKQFGFSDALKLIPTESE